MTTDRIRTRLMNMFLCDPKATFKDQVAMWAAIGAVEKQEKYLGFINSLIEYILDNETDEKVIPISFIYKNLKKYNLLDENNNIK